MLVNPASRATAPDRSQFDFWPLLATVSIFLPTLLAFNLPPSSTFLNQAAALIGWGAWLLVLAGSVGAGAGPFPRGLACLQAALALLMLAALAAPLWAAQPWSLALSAAALLGAAALAAQVAAQAARGGLALPAFRAFCIGLVAAGVLCSAVGFVQVFAPGWADGNWIARSTLEGRAVGNMRQPNHLSSLLLWAIVAAVWLGEARVLWRGGAALLALLFVFVVVLTGSRTGALSMLLLTAWGALDRRLSRPARALLIAAPLLYGAFWLATGAWAGATQHVFGGETRFSTQGDVSSSRLAIWSNTLALIRLHPWAGVGFGEFNFAWTLTPFPNRPVAFFDHTHNIVLQFLVELGLPLGLAVLALLLAAIWHALRGALPARVVPDDAAALHRRTAPGAALHDLSAPGAALWRPAAFMVVLLILLHSLLEYPLWYAYFLLPAAFAFGLCLAAPAAAAPAVDRPAADAGRRPLAIAALVLMLGGIGSVFDYLRVVAIFAPPDNAAPLAQRIVDGRSSVFFAHQADYAAATTADRPADAMPAFLRAPHFLIDSRLLQAWAKALDAAGDTEHARHLAQRLREFHNEQSLPFFAPCAAPPEPGKALPFQCVAPTRAFGYEDFR